jgi:hypothetical protein
VDLGRAAAVLGSGPGAGPAELRARFRRLLMEHHPDRGGSDGATRELLEAYDVLLAAAGSAASDAAAADAGATDGASDAPPEGARVWRSDDDTIAVALPADEAYVALVEAAHRMGSVTYVDRHCGVLEALLRTVGGTTVSMLVTLQGRATGYTDVFVSLEAIDAVHGELPGIVEVTEILGQLVDRVLSRT